MTEIETIRAMLARAGLKYEEGDYEDLRAHVTYDAITVEDGGYSGFVSQFWFDKATGALKHMAAWE